MELKLEVWDSPNSAGVVIDAIRCLKLALENGVSGALEAPSSYFMKSPPVQFADDDAHDKVEEFIARYTKQADRPAEGAEVRMAALSETVTQPAPLATSDGVPVSNGAKK
jgi:myo-inositol-1-phosphate synthase